ncbi:MAG TPA: MFS transporter [Thermoanaerobaculia bacterium]|nr:MFS transporter [Thermoanaerobaculia bacterium]
MLATSSSSAPARLSLHQRPGGTHRRILGLAWGAWCTGFYSLMLLSFLLPQIQTEFALSEAGLARLTAVGVGMSGVGGLLFGWMSDRMGRRASLAASVAAFSLGNAACGLAGSEEWLILARAVAGLGIGGTWGGGQAMLGETFPPALRGRYGAIAQSGAPVGLGLAAIVGSFVALAIGWRATFLLSAAPILALLFFRHLPESDLWLEHRRRLREGLADVRHARRPILAQLVSLDLAGLFVRAFLLTAFNMSAYWFAVVWLPRYLQREQGLSIFGSGWWTLTFVVGSLLGYLSFGWVSDRLGRRRAFTLYCGITAVGLALVVLLGDIFTSDPAIGLACLFVAGVGTGTWSCYGPYFSELFPTRVRGAAMSVIMNVTRGIQFLAPLAIAAIGEHWRLAGGLALAAGFAALAGAWVWTLPETAGASLEV